jgi:hypothetical protein
VTPDMPTNPERLVSVPVWVIVVPLIVKPIIYSL